MGSPQVSMKDESVQRRIKMSDQNKLNRREFIKGAAISGAGLAAAGALGACSPTPVPATAVPATAVPATAVPTKAPASVASWLPAKWDYEADVVVLGTGTVAVAPLVANEAGAKVLILEKAAEFGGTSATSGGSAYIPNNYLMREAGLPDSREKALTYLRRTADGQSSEELMTAYVDKGNEMLEWLRDKAGFKWRVPAPTPKRNNYEYYPFEGSASVSRSTSIVREDGVTSGRGLWLSFKEATVKRGIQILYKTPGKRLITNPEGEVMGVVAESEGKEIAIKARRAVIIGTGGFDYNREMVRHFLRGPLHASNAVPGNTGDGHLMAMAIGADLRNMNECWGLPFFKPVPDAYSGIADWYIYRGKPGTVIVNKYGERIGDESANYDTFEKAFHSYDSGLFEWRNIPSFCLFDSGYTKRYGLPGGAMVGDVPAWITKADTLDALATALKIDVSGLKSTMGTFNKNASEGLDPVWHRGEYDYDKFNSGDPSRTDLKNTALAPLETPPYYGAAIWPGTCGTCGGLRTNANAQVLNVWGKAIPRLYCTSNTMASVMGVGYTAGGGTLGPGLVFGYIAAKHAVGLAPWA